MLCLRGQPGRGRDGKVSCGQGQGLPVLSVRRRVSGGAQADVGEIRGESAALLILAGQTDGSRFPVDVPPYHAGKKRIILMVKRESKANDIFICCGIWNMISRIIEIEVQQCGDQVCVC